MLNVVNVKEERERLIEHVKTDPDSKLDFDIVGFVYSDWTTKLDDNYCFYVGKGTLGRLAKFERNVYHKNICKKYGFNRRIEGEFHTERELLVKEIELIEIYNTFNSINSLGANFTLGGEGSQGYRFSEEACKKRRGKENKYFGVPRKPETKLKISESKRLYHPTRKQVDQLSLSGEFIRTFESAREIERILGFNHASISKCCMGKQITAFGFTWRYALT